MLSIVFYVDPGTSSAIITSVWQFIAIILTFIAGFFIGMYKSFKNVVKKLWESIKRAL